MKALYPALGLVCLLGLPMITQAETLEQIYELALENDAQLKADRAAYMAGKEDYKIARGGLLPNVAASASYGTTDSEATGQDGAIGGGAPRIVDRESDTDRTAWGATLTQPLFNMRLWYGYKRGQVTSEVAEANFGAQQQNFMIRVARAYFDVLRAVDSLETSLAEERAIKSQLEQTKQRYEVGLTAITDVHEAQAEYDRARATMLDARGQLGIAFEALQVLTGDSPNAIAPIGDNFPVTNPEPASREEWVNFALENNYSLLAAKLTADSAKYLAKTAKSDHFPTLTGRVNYSNEDVDTDGINNGTLLPSNPFPRSYSDTDTETTSVTINLDVPIFTGGTTSATRRKAHYQYVQNLELYNNTRRNTIQQARTSHLLVETSAATVFARQQAIVSSQSALEATQAGYEVGTRTLVDVLLSQRALYQAQRAYYTELYNYIINTLQLKQVAGLLSPQDILDLNQSLDAVNQIQRSTYQQQ